MKILNSIGINLLLFAITDSLTLKILGIIYLIISILVELYVIGDEKQKGIN